ncbi:MAG: hypothetical protein AAGA15_13680 [Pseudomonadota bacterium]
MKATTLVLVACCALLFSPRAEAATVTYDFEITIDTIESDGGNLFSSNGLQPGSTIVGRLSYDDTATNIDIGSNSALWRFDTLSWEFGVGAPDLILASGFSTGFDQWALLGSLPLGTASGVSATFTADGDFGFGSSTLGANFDNPIIGPPVLDDLRVDLSYGLPFQSFSGTAFGTVDLALVPLPAGAGLLLGGLGILALLGWRRRGRPFLSA